MYLELSGVCKSFRGKPAVRDLDLGVERGQLLCLLGSSGCGKTTTLNMIGGFLEPDRGTIELDGQDITHMPAEARPTATVFQSYALFGHWDVWDNVAYGLRLRKVARDERRARVDAMLDLVGLADFAHARVHELSGGQQQRVALARALVVEPKVCLLDEPFCNLDATLRTQMRVELKELQHELGMTMIFVTHDQEEAYALADQVVVMRDGAVEQQGAPREVYANPSGDFVANFLGTDTLRWDDEGRLLKVIG